MFQVGRKTYYTIGEIASCLGVTRQRVSTVLKERKAKVVRVAETGRSAVLVPEKTISKLWGDRWSNALRQS